MRISYLVQKTLNLVDELESEVSKLYRILDSHKILIQPTDLAMYQTLSPTLRSLKEALDVAIDSREDSIVKFTADLEKLMSDLLLEVSEIRNAAQDPMVLNPTSNSNEVIKYLDELKDKLEKLNQLKINYESWGKIFKSGGLTDAPTEETEQESQMQPIASPEATLEMEETIKEVELKGSLWTSLKEWDQLIE